MLKLIVRTCPDKLPLGGTYLEKYVVRDLLVGIGTGTAGRTPSERSITGFDTHDDMPIEIRDELYAEDQQWQERQHKMSKSPQSQGSGLPININFLPHSPQPPALATPADTPPTLPHSNTDMVDTFLIPDLSLDTVAGSSQESTLTRLRTISRRPVI